MIGEPEQRGAQTVRRPTIDSRTVAAYRVDIPCQQAGFNPPPCAVQLKFLPLGTRWTLLALTTPGRAPDIASWLQAYRPASLEIAPGLAPKVLRATFDALPPTWDRMLSGVIVHYLELSPDGAASLFVQDSRTNVKRFIDVMPPGLPVVRARRRLEPGERVQLTARQLEAVSLAVALGYYELPHKLNLRTLAGKLGLSVGATSELLRRGESLIVTGYLDALAEARWAGGPEPSIMATATAAKTL